MKKEKILEELERLQEIKNYRVLREQDEKLLNLSSNVSPKSRIIFFKF